MRAKGVNVLNSLAGRGIRFHSPSKAVRQIIFTDDNSTQIGSSIYYGTGTEFGP